MLYDMKELQQLKDILLQRDNEISILCVSQQLIAPRFYTRNTLDCDQSNYSSRIVFSHIPIEFGQTGISAIISADTENPILEPNTE